ncbi:unnamed protein product [Plutella xylostella]|uniref:(diamondback moth) hypothetical protein n=1 Tax=Plutella xylostella TaxID=51655 RepID=A0A8S4FG25_PLUXY|nr:unnamed protein product [Plutella xylostella]
MRIFLFLCAGLALGGCDKLDRTYLPPPGSKFSGGSPGAILGPLDSPKESTFPTSGTTGFIEQGLNNQPGYRQGPLQAQTTSTPGYGFTRQDISQSPGQFGGANNRIPPVSQAPGLPQAPFNPSVQNAIRNYQNQFNLPSTTTSYAFSQTTTYPPSEGDFETSTGPTDLPGQELAFGPIPSQNPSNTYQNNGFADQSPIQEVPILQKSPSGTPINRPGFMQRPQNNIVVNPDQSNLMDPQVDRNQGTLQSGSQYSGFPNLSQDYVQENTPVDKPTTYQPSLNSPNIPKTPGSTVPGLRDQYGNFVPSSVSQNVRGQSENPLQGYRQNDQVPILTNNGNPFAPTQFSSSTNPSFSNADQNQNLASPSSSAQSTVSSYNPKTQGTLSPNENFRSQGSFNTPNTHDKRFNDIPGRPTSLTSSNVSSNTTSSYKPTLPSYNGDQKELKGTSENRPERVQAEADRNAVILNYDALITPDGDFSYSFDTSNGIHADESGTASDGVKAKGSYSYIGDDGKLYKVVYTADENGFRPQGDHLPTPPPIPEAILRVIEQANRDKEAGIIHDGSYDEEKYGYKKYSGLMDNFKSQPEKDNDLSVNRPNSIRGDTVANGSFNKNMDTNEPYESENNKFSDTTSSRNQLQPKLPSQYSKERNDERRISEYSNRAPFKNEGRPSQTAYLDKTNTQNQFDEKYYEKRPSSVQNKGPTANNYDIDASISRNKLSKTENDLNPTNDNRNIEQTPIKTNYPNRKQQYGYKNDNTAPDLKMTEKNISYKPNEGQNTGNIANNESFRQYDNDGNIVTKIKLPNIPTKESDNINKQPAHVFDPYVGTENQYLPTDSNDYDLLEETDVSLQPDSGSTMTTPSDNQSMDGKNKFFEGPQKSFIRNNVATLNTEPLKKSTISRPSPYLDSTKGIITATDSSIDDEETGYEYSHPQQKFNLGMTEFEKEEQTEDRNKIPKEFVSDKYGVRRPTARPNLGPQSPIITRPSLINSQQNVRPGLTTNKQFPPYSNEQRKTKTQLPSDTTQIPFGARIPTLAPVQNYPVTQRNQYNNRRVPTTPGRTNYPVDDTNMSTTPMSPEIPSELGSVEQSGAYPTNQPSTSIITDSTSPSYYTDKGFPTTNIPSRLNGFTKNETNTVQSGQIPYNKQVAISKSATENYPGINSDNDNYGFNPNSDTTPNDGSREELYRRPSQNNGQQYSTTPDYPKETPTYQPSYSTSRFNNNPTDPNNVFSTAIPNYQGENSQEFNTPPGVVQGPTNVPFSSQNTPIGSFQQFNTPYTGRPQRPTFMPISSQNPSSGSQQFSTPSDFSQRSSDVPFSSQYPNNYPTTSRTQNLDYNGDFPATGTNAGINQKVPALNANYTPEGQSRPQEIRVDSESSVDMRPFKDTTSAPANINREDFSGARRPQYFDPITGYHY